MNLKFADIRRIFVVGFCLGMALAVIEKVRPWPSTVSWSSDVPPIMKTMAVGSPAMPLVRVIH